MEKVNHIVVTKKEEKKINELRHLFELMGLSLESIAGIVEENKRLKEEISSLRAEQEAYQEEAKTYIQGELSKISVNVHNEVVKSNEKVKKNIETYLFKGNRINESY